MAITLEDAVEVAYRSIAIGTACAKTLKQIANEPRNENRQIADRNPNNPQGAEANLFKAAFTNLGTCASYAIRFYETGTLYPEYGSVKDRLEKLWRDDLGNNVVDLPDWNTFANLSIAEPLTFTQRPDAATEGLQSTFVDNSSEILNASTPFRQQVKDCLDSMISDLWRAEGMRRWTESEATLTGEPQAAQDEWNFIQSATAQFWIYATTQCLVKVDDQIGRIDDPNFGSTGHQESLDKYMWVDSGPAGQRNDLVCAGGLYAIDQSQLTGVWNSRWEAVVRPSAR